MLPESARAELAYTLVSSLNVPADANAAEEWDKKILPRLAEVDRLSLHHLFPSARIPINKYFTKFQGHNAQLRQVADTARNKYCVPEISWANLG